MKSKHISITARLTGIATAIALFAGVASSLQAQTKGRRNYGIAERSAVPRRVQEESHPRSCAREDSSDGLFELQRQSDQEG
jgi:hypothetical protein